MMEAAAALPANVVDTVKHLAVTPGSGATRPQSRSFAAAAANRHFTQDHDDPGEHSDGDDEALGPREGNFVGGAPRDECLEHMLGVRGPRQGGFSHFQCQACGAQLFRYTMHLGPGRREPLSMDESCALCAARPRGEKYVEDFQDPRVNPADEALLRTWSKEVPFFGRTSYVTNTALAPAATGWRGNKTPGQGRAEKTKWASKREGEDVARFLDAPATTSGDPYSRVPTFTETPQLGLNAMKHALWMPTLDAFSGGARQLPAADGPTVNRVVQDLSRTHFVFMAGAAMPHVNAEGAKKLPYSTLIRPQPQLRRIGMTFGHRAADGSLPNMHAVGPMAAAAAAAAASARARPVPLPTQACLAVTATHARRAISSRIHATYHDLPPCALLLPVRVGGRQFAGVDLHVHNHELLENKDGDARGGVFLERKSRVYDSMTYPVLFGCGQPGWSYLNYRDQRPVKDGGATKFYTMRDWYAGMMLASSQHFLNAYAVSELFLCDCWLRWVHQMSYTREEEIRKGRGLLSKKEAVAADGKAEPGLLNLPGMDVDSPQYYRQHMMDLLHLCYVWKTPSLFATLVLPERTVEDELADVLRTDGGEPVPLVRAPVHAHRLFRLLERAFEALMDRDDILGGVELAVKVLELQERHNPHSHWAIWLVTKLLGRVALSTYPDSAGNGPEVAQVFEKHSVACEEDLPRCLSPEEAADCMKTMKHVCGPWCRGKKAKWKIAQDIAAGLRCSRGFPFPLAEQPYWDSYGNYHNRRLTDKDRMLEPTSPLIWRHLRAHFSLRVINDARALMGYFFSYILKAKNLHAFRAALVTEVQRRRRGAAGPAHPDAQKAAPTARDLLLTTISMTPLWSYMRLRKEAPVRGVPMTRLQTHLPEQNLVKPARDDEGRIDGKKTKAKQTPMQLWFCRPESQAAVRYQDWWRQFYQRNAEDCHAEEFLTRGPHPVRMAPRGADARAPPKKFIGSAEFAPIEEDDEVTEAGLRFGTHNSWIRNVMPGAGTEAFYLLLMANEFPDRALHVFHDDISGGGLKQSAWDRLRGTHKSFRDAAVHHGLWDLGKSGEQHLQYVAEAGGTRRDFRRTAATLLRHAAITYEQLTDRFFEQLTGDFTWSDYAKKSPMYRSRLLEAASQPRQLSDVQRDECLRRELHAILGSDGTSAHYGVPAPRFSCQYILDAEAAFPREDAIAAVVKFEKEVVANPHSLLAYVYLRRLAVLRCPGGRPPKDVPLSDFPGLTARGRALVARMEALAEEDHAKNRDMAHFPGSAGTGKSHLCDGFAALCAALRLVFQAVTHNATGTQELRFCRTAHAYFAMSIDDPPVCRLRAHHKHALRRVDFLWFDECSQYTRSEINVPAEQMRHLRAKPERHFGGAFAIFSGDFTQLLGVTDTNETDEAQYERCLMSWTDFRAARTFRLNTPMRCPSMALFRFAQLLGEGALNDDRDRMFLLPTTPVIECASRVDWRLRLPEIVSKLYDGTRYFAKVGYGVAQTGQDPHLTAAFATAAAAAADCLYLAPHNATVEAVNEAVMDQLPEPEYPFRSQTWPGADVSGLREDSPPPAETDHLVETSGSLPGMLRLRLGALLRLQSLHMGREGSLKGTLAVLTRVVGSHTLEVAKVKQIREGVVVTRHEASPADFGSVRKYQQFLHSGAATVRLTGTDAVPRATIRVPRVRQRMTVKQPHGLDDGPHVTHYLRKQFPAKPAFAQTIDSAEGRTATKVICDLLSQSDDTKRAALWGHGRLKVAYTRTRDERGTTFIVKPGQRTVPNPVNRCLYPRASAAARKSALQELEQLCPGVTNYARAALSRGIDRDAADGAAEMHSNSHAPIGARPPAPGATLA